MSPLIDVTNTALDVQVESSHTRTQKQQRSCQKGRDVDSQRKSGKSVSHEVTVKDEILAIQKCNTLLASQASTTRDCSSGMGLPRVPPLPQTADVLLSEAVQALSLSAPKNQTKPRSRRRLGRHKGNHQEHGEQHSNNVVSSNSGLPEKFQESHALSSPKQCGACGLEFTSMPVLTQHLVRHVYDGLYAAQWLTQAMDLVSNRQSPEGSSTLVMSDDNESQVLNSHVSSVGH